jgi:parvulin-like peptidyl-prolyl isomerase
MITTLLTALALAPVSGLFSDIPTNMLPPKPIATKVLVTIDGVPLKQSDVDGVLWDWHSQAIIDELIGYQVIKNEAKKQSITVTQKEILDAIKMAIANYSASLPKGANAEEEMRKQGFPPSRVFLTWQAKLLTEKLMLRRFDKTEYFKISTMAFPIASEQATDLADAIKKAQSAYDQLAKGGDWDKILAANTTDVNTIKSKGLLGWRSLGIFPASVQTELKKLSKGGITKPAQTGYGIQIFRIEELGKDASGPDLEKLRNQFTSSGQQQFVQKLRQAAKIVKK